MAVHVDRGLDRLWPSQRDTSRTGTPRARTVDTKEPRTVIRRQLGRLSQSARTTILQRPVREPRNRPPYPHGYLLDPAEIQQPGTPDRIQPSNRTRPDLHKQVAQYDGITPSTFQSNSTTFEHETCPDLHAYRSG